MNIVCLKASLALANEMPQRGTQEPYQAEGHLAPTLALVLSGDCLLGGIGRGTCWVILSPNFHGFLPLV
jgi:hypothetical protein